MLRIKPFVACGSTTTKRVAGAPCPAHHSLSRLIRAAAGCRTTEAATTSQQQQLPQHHQHEQHHVSPAPISAPNNPLSGAVLASSLSLAALALLADPASAQVLNAQQVHNLADALRPLLTLLTFLYIVRIPMTWYPNLNPNEFPWNLAVGPTEPILAATRKVVPLVGGVDITPIVWVGLLSFANEILLGPQGLLVLIERQGGI